MKKLVIFILVLFVAHTSFSQDTLPNFELVERGDRVVISWINPYQNLIQLNVQRSYDSLRNFSTIFSATSPELPQNGYSDVKKPTTRIYYRIFYVLEGGSYYFSRAKRASGTPTYSGTATPTPTNGVASRDLTSPAFNNVTAGDRRMVTVKIKDTIYRQLSINSFRNFRDSILHATKDTLFAINDSLVRVNPYVQVDEWKASQFIFANKEGYINIALPLVNEKKYHVKFFEEDGTSLFEIRNVKESPLILDKSSFIRSGWFLFELYEDNKLKEKNKFYLPKDF